MGAKGKAKASKKEKGKKKDKQKSGNTPFPLKIDNALTACELLSIPEDHVVLAALAVIDQYITMDEYKHIKKLLPLQLIGKITALLLKENIIPEMFRLILKTLLRITAYEPFLLIVLAEENITPCFSLVDFFVNTNDLFFLEKYIVLLQRFLRCPEFKRRLCDPQIVAKLFTLMSKCSVVTVRHNCLKLLHVLIHCSYLTAYMEFIRAFHIETLHKLIREEELKPLVLNIFEKLTKWTLPCIHLALYEADCTNRFLELLMEHYNWSETNNQIVEILFNLTRNTNYKYLNVATQSFFKYFHFGRFTNPEHALACLALIDQFSNSPLALEALHEFGLTKHFSEFADFGCPLVKVKMCQCLAKLFQGCHYLEESVYRKYIRIFGDILKESNYPWIPYRQAPLLPLFKFLIKHPELTEYFSKFRILSWLKLAFLNRNSLEKQYYKYIIDIYHIILSKELYQEELLSKEIYNVFYCKFKECLTDKKDLCNANSVFLKLLYLTFSLPKYRAIFLERKGHILICNALSTHCSKLSDILISFLKAVTRFDELAFAFLRAGIIDIIKKLSEGEISRRIGILSHLGEDFLEKDFTVKFYISNVLEPTHEILTTFVVPFSRPPEYFPLKDPPKKQKICFEDTLVVVHLGEPKVSVEPPPNSLMYFDHYKKMIEDYYQLMKETEGLYCGDPFIPYYIATLRDKFSSEENLNIGSKVLIVAQFVHQLLSKSENGKMPSAYNCLAHRNELKIQLRSNFLPLGFFRLGGLLERAILFKVLSDHLGIPCRLLRNKTSVNFLWNEVIMECSETRLSQKCVAENSNQNEYSPLIKTVTNWNAFWSDLEKFYDEEDIIAEQEIEEEEDETTLITISDSDERHLVANSKERYPTIRQSVDEISLNVLDLEGQTKSQIDQITSSISESCHEISATESLSPDSLKFCLQTFVVDLKNDIGALYVVESKKAQTYLNPCSPEYKK